MTSFIWCRIYLNLTSKSTSVSSLLEYPEFADALEKTSTTFLSSAAVRLSSAACQVLTARKCRLADGTTSKLIFIRSVFKDCCDFGHV